MEDLKFDLNKEQTIIVDDHPEITFKVPKYKCSKHGKTANMSIFIGEDISNNGKYEQIDYCLKCFRDLLEANCEKTEVDNDE